MLKIIILFVVCFSTTVSAANKQQAQQELSQIKNQMGKLEQTITEAVHSREKLYRTLADTEKEISQQVHSLHAAAANIREKQTAIQKISLALNDLEHQLKHKQNELINHLRMRYQLGDIQPLQWVLNPDKPQAMGRFLSYYQYLIKDDERLIQNIQQTKNDIAANQEKLNAELAALKTLQNNLIVQQKQLSQSKQQHRQVLHTLNQTIETKQQKMADYKQSETRLQNLIEQLSKTPISRTVIHSQGEAADRLTTIKLNHKLTYPLQNHRLGKPLNHGMLFVAQEGTPVNAVLPGKVVFSDWLNGYGLLLIIDHGEGTMSLYAHNESLFKSKGTWVKSGEQIATVGHTGGIRENGLYFELRRRGKVIPPRQWLA